MLSWVCFYCSNPINFEGRYVEAQIRHHYKGGGSRDSARRFHSACFEKFEQQRGRLYNPETEYEVLVADEMGGLGDARRLRPIVN